jgi:hypothetical protein
MKKNAQPKFQIAMSEEAWATVLTILANMIDEDASAAARILAQGARNLKASIRLLSSIADYKEASCKPSTENCWPILEIPRKHRTPAK